MQIYLKAIMIDLAKNITFASNKPSALFIFTITK